MDRFKNFFQLNRCYATIGHENLLLISARIVNTDNVSSIVIIQNVSTILIPAQFSQYFEKLLQLYIQRQNYPQYLCIAVCVSLRPKLHCLISNRIFSKGYHRRRLIYLKEGYPCKPVILLWKAKDSAMVEQNKDTITFLVRVLQRKLRERNRKLTNLSLEDILFEFSSKVIVDNFWKKREKRNTWSALDNKIKVRTDLNRWSQTVKPETTLSLSWCRARGLVRSQ